MTLALGAITKPWETQQKIATLVSDEFFYQGDLEKEELHLEPIPMMDRVYKDKLPSMQVQSEVTSVGPNYYSWDRNVVFGIHIQSFLRNRLYSVFIIRSISKIQIHSVFGQFLQFVPTLGVTSLYHQIDIELLI